MFFLQISTTPTALLGYWTQYMPHLGILFGLSCQLTSKSTLFKEGLNARSYVGNCGGVGGGVVNLDSIARWEGPNKLPGQMAMVPVIVWLYMKKWQPSLWGENFFSENLRLVHLWFS